MSDIMADDLWVGGDSKTDNQPWHLMMNFEAIPTNMTVSYTHLPDTQSVSLIFLFTFY